MTWKPKLIPWVMWLVEQHADTPVYLCPSFTSERVQTMFFNKVTGHVWKKSGLGSRHGSRRTWPWSQLYIPLYVLTLNLDPVHAIQVEWSWTKGISTSNGVSLSTTQCHTCVCVCVPNSCMSLKLSIYIWNLCVVIVWHMHCTYSSCKKRMRVDELM